MGKIETLNQRYWARLNEEIKNYSNFNPHKPKQNEYKLRIWQTLCKHISEGQFNTGYPGVQDCHQQQRTV